MTKFKIARGYFLNDYKQTDIAKSVNCHKNTINNIINKCKARGPDDVIWKYLHTNIHISQDNLDKLFSFLKNNSRVPHKCRLGFAIDSKEEKLIISKFSHGKYGYKRMYRHLKKQGYDVNNVYTLGNIKGVYKRNKLKAKKIRTSNGERRPLYNYDVIGAFEYLQYDTKEILDKHALPADIYEKFKNNPSLPKYQWTIIDAKTRVRFLAWSYHRCSFFGFKFLEYVICYLRAHNIDTKINIQMDMGSEFYSGSQKKQKEWNRYFNTYNAYVYDTEGQKWKQNLVERSHKTDDEEFYCPRAYYIENNFLTESQFWNLYYNNRSHSGDNMKGLSPEQKLEELGIVNADSICNFPCLILDDFFRPFQLYFDSHTNINEENKKSQNVLTPYLSILLFA